MTGRRDFFLIRARFASFHTHTSLLAFFVCFFILFHSRCFHAQVFGKTLVHEFHISYSRTDGTSIFPTVRKYKSYTFCIRSEKVEILVHYTSKLNYFDYVVIFHRHFFFRACFTSFHTPASLLTFGFCFFVLFHSCCYHA